MITFEQARSLVLENVSPLEAERVPLPEALGRAIAETVRAPADMPPWDNSAMDGYAVRSEDCRGPVTLDVVGFRAAGAGGGPAVSRGTAIRIMTGGPIPEGADAVVPLEETVPHEGKVSIRGPVRAGAHIRVRGEDVPAGETVVRAGTTLRPPEIGMLASFGMAAVSVHRRARVALLSTGDELVELGESPAAGKIVNSNAHSLAAALREIGAVPSLLGIARDTREDLRARIAEGLLADALVTTAGVSMGDRDLVRDVLAELSVRQLFWKVAVRPGHPTAFGLSGRTPVFALPGNPVSCLVIFDELARPALLRMMGHASPRRPLIRVALGERVEKKAGRTMLLRVRIEERNGRVVATAAGNQSTGILKTMLSANGIAILPPDRTAFEAGEEVDAHFV